MRNRTLVLIFGAVINDGTTLVQSSGRLNSRYALVEIIGQGAIGDSGQFLVTIYASNDDNTTLADAQLGTSIVSPISPNRDFMFATRRSSSIIHLFHVFPSAGFHVKARMTNEGGQNRAFRLVLVLEELSDDFDNLRPGLWS